MNRVIKSVYNPKIKNKNEDNSRYFLMENIHFYPLGRIALFEGLKLLNLKPGDVVLCPSLICRDLLAAFNELSLVVCYYDLNRDLSPVEIRFEDNVKAILFINYFGFSKSYDLYKNFASKHNIFLIEDNAHGFLSKEEKLLLGTRGDISITSFRKTFQLKSGAILYSRNHKLEKQNFSNGRKPDAKKVWRFVFQIIGVIGIFFLQNLKRKLRLILKGTELPVDNIEDEKVLPLIANNYDYYSYFKTISFKREIARRKRIFEFVKEILAKYKDNFLFSELDNFVPYGFPLIIENDDDLNEIKVILSENYLELIHWPSLPSEILDKVPNFYFKIYFVRFLW